MAKPLVGVLMGSKSDAETMTGVTKVLDEFGVPYEVHVMSAHRTPDVMVAYAKGAKAKGLKVLIGGAGMSAHLPGMVAALTTLPVISIPLRNADHDHEALWSNIAMPPGIPLATLPENGTKNAALYAIRILALSDETLSQKYESFIQKMHDEVLTADQSLQS